MTKNDLLILKFRLKLWLLEHEPVFCFACRNLVFYKYTRRETTTSGIRVNLCKKCHKELINPMEDDE